ncbi:MAG: hypothetical protein GY816_17930 [Cytophagales bacterium]|nr:hypothetical protein [Cytophagales bacterium]
MKGIKGLKDLKRGVKSEDKKLLSRSEEQKIQDMIYDTMLDQLIPYALWTRKAVMELVEPEFGVKLAVRREHEPMKKRIKF